MNYQDFSKLKVGDMVKVRCPYCDVPHYYIGKVTDKILRWYSYPGFRGTYKEELAIKTDIPGLGGAKINAFDIVRKLPKPEKRTAYWCKTMDDAKNFLEDCEAWGINWAGGDDKATEWNGWRLSNDGVMFYLHTDTFGYGITETNCITWSEKTDGDIPNRRDLDIDRYIEYPSGRVLWDRAEEEAKKKAEEEAKKKAEPVSFKVRCVWKRKEADSEFTVGKIYEWKNGKLTDDTGFTFENMCNSSNIDKWKFTVYKFVKVTEEELKAEEKYAETIRSLGKAATLGSEIIKFSQEAWYKFAETYAVTDSLRCCCKNKCCSCANFKPEIRSGSYPWGVKEVKRPAKVGEYIKIVDDWHGCKNSRYLIGDIGKVVEVGCRCYTCIVSINGHERAEVSHSEYVVLENYVPEVREVKRPAKVGEYIKLTSKEFSFSKVGDILKVSRTGDCSVGVKPEDHPRETTKLFLNDMWYYPTHSYVVLENYVPEVKEVDRCAKVGEYIKIVDEWHTADTKGKYTNGDIGLVTRGCNGCAIRISINGHDDVPVSDVPREYVVLENYRP